MNKKIYIVRNTVDDVPDEYAFTCYEKAKAFAYYELAEQEYGDKVEFLDDNTFTITEDNDPSTTIEYEIVEVELIK